MRTTIRMNPQLLAQAKKQAAESGTTLTALIEEAVRESLARRSAAKSGKKFTLPLDKTSKLRPGVDLSNSAQLWDILDGM